MPKKKKTNNKTKSTNPYKIKRNYNQIRDKKNEPKMLYSPKLKTGKDASDSFIFENNKNNDNHKDTDLQLSKVLNYENSEVKIENNNNSYLINNFIQFAQFNTINLNTDIPPDNSVENNNLYRYQNKFLYYKILSKEDLNINDVEEIEITKDGNCYFNSLSLFYTGT